MGFRPHSLFMFVIVVSVCVAVTLVEVSIMFGSRGGGGDLQYSCVVCSL